MDKTVITGEKKINFMIKQIYIYTILSTTLSKSIKTLADISFYLNLIDFKSAVCSAVSYPQTVVGTAEAQQKDM